MRTALITGANKSIGFETAKQLAKEGYFVYLGCRDIKKGEAAVAALKAEGLTQLQAIQIDVTDKASILAARENIPSLDVLVNNAGISGGFPQAAATTETAVIREVFDTNFFGVIEVTLAFMDLLKQSAQPVIVNVTSGLGSITLHNDPSWQYYNVKSAAYGPSKSALNAFTVVLAYELKDFKVNVVDPGHTATDFNHHRGPGSVVDAGVFVAKYAALDADGPTGQFFSLDIKEEGNQSPW